MDNPHNTQVQAFIAEAEKFASVQDAGNGEFIIDGVVNVREAITAALEDARGKALEEAIDAIAKKKWFFASEEWVTHQCVTAIRALVKPVDISATPG